VRADDVGRIDKDFAPLAIVDISSRPVRVIAPAQAPNEARQHVAEALGIDMAELGCGQARLGGGFGPSPGPKGL